MIKIPNARYFILLLSVIHLLHHIYKSNPLRNTKIHCLYFILYSVLLINIKVCYAQNDYYLDIDKNDIKVFLKEDPKDNYIEYKAVMQIESIYYDNVVRLFLDYKNHTKWVYNCIDSYLLKKDKNNTYLYQSCKSHWPFKKRDFVLNITSKQIDANTLEVYFTSEKDILSENESHIRINEFVGKWQLKKEGEKTIITIYSSFNPKIRLPPFLIEKYASEIPYYTLSNLKYNLLALK